MTPYDIAVDERRHTLRASLRGFWDNVIADSYIADLAAAGSRIARGGAATWWLIEADGWQVQSREVAELLGRRLPSLFPRATTLAMVVDAKLTSVQGRRVVPNEHHRHFTTRADAEGWLIEQGMPT